MFNSIWEIFYLPNIISYLRILLLIPIFYSVNIEDNITGIILIFIAGITDFADGALARYLKIQSKYGELLDPIADKIFVIGCATILVINELVPVWLITLFGIRDILILFGARYMQKKGIKNLSPTFSSKINTSVQFFYFGSVLVSNYNQILLIISNISMYLSVVTIFISSYSYAKRFIYTLNK